MSGIKVGQIIELTDGRKATIRFVGQTHFASGDWVGVELDDDGGKNDGSVQGERYFDCEMGRGMFVRPTTIAVIQQPAPPPPSQRPKPAQRPNSMTAAPGARRPSVPDPQMTRRISLNAPSPSPVNRTRRPSSLVRVLAHKVTDETAWHKPHRERRDLANRHPSNARVSSVGTRPARGASGGSSRTSMAPPALPPLRSTRQASTSSTSSATGRGGVARTQSGRSSTATRGGRGGVSRPAGGRVTSGESLSGNEAGFGKGSDIGSPLKSDGEQGISPVQSRTQALEKLTGPAGSKASTPGTTTPASRTASGTARPAANNALTRENEDLKTKLKVLERKRLEDKEKLKELENIQEQHDKFVSINKKIEGKFQTTAQENSSLRKQLKEAEDRLGSIETLQAEHDSILELATLDREMAQEEAEVFKAELDALKLKAEELELDNEILRDEKAEYEKGTSAEDRQSTNWMQLERQNERLKEALIRFRDLKEEEDEKSKELLKSLQRDLTDFEAIREQYDIAKEKLVEAEMRVEDLKEQLDNADAAEEMIEKLSSDLFTQGEHVKELNATIEELEELREINDELEANHVQNEKEMQKEMDFKDTVIAEQARRMGQQDDNIEDMEYTLSRFRELVMSLQTDLEDMRASHAVNEVESEQLNSKSRQMMDLNLKLQISAAKTQVKTIDLELQKMDAQEAQQHLQIVKLFLPETYDADKNSVLALLRFRRLAFKANLLHGFIKDRVGGQAHPGHEDDIFAGCDALDKLVWVSSMCDRFVNAISHCTLEEFAKYDGALFELEPVERALNGWIDGLRRDELKEKQCASELSRTIALMTHLGEVHISDGLESFADNVQMRTVMMQSHLESAAAAFAVVKDLVQRVVPANGEDDELAQHFSRKVEAVVSQTRSAKVIVGKAVRALEDLKARHLSLTTETGEAFEQCESATQELSDMSRKIGSDLHALTSEEGRTEPLTYSDISTTVHRTVQTTYSASETDLFSSYLSKLRTLTSQIADLAAVCADLSQTQEFDRSQEPWIVRAQELKALKTVPVDAEEELRQLKESYNDLRRAVAVRDENLSTSNLRIETLEARMRDANAKAARMTELEAQILDAQASMSKLKEDIEKQDRELKTLEGDRDKWKKVAGDSQAFGTETGSASGGAGGPNNKAGQERAVATAREMDVLRNEIASLQAAVRYLREDNRRARAADQLHQHNWLAEPLLKNKPSPAEQRRELVAAESRDVLAELLKMAGSAAVYDLKTLPAGRLAAWRPAVASPQYHAARRAEDWASWKGWRDDVLDKARTVAAVEKSTAAGAAAREEREIKRRAAARLRIRMPGADGKMVPGAGGEVRIAGSQEWEGVLGKVET
ncbi:CAP-Gly domain-containing protein [Apiospora hydei]|uniref:CAP-Gly domain-containing protein n=1 Tax=Apiospora hydei TaxID=1337664 RepID=A0ABR1XC52_9PEZI